MSRQKIFQLAASDAATLAMTIYWEELIFTQKLALDFCLGTSYSNNMFRFKNTCLPTGKKGFTLIELLIVIVVIALLSTMVMVNIGRSTSRGRDARRTSDLKQMATALELYFQAKVAYPLPGANCWDTDTTCWGTIDTLLKPYMPLAPKDPKQSVSCVPGSADCYTYYYCRLNLGPDRFVIAANLENPLNQPMDPNTSCQTGGPNHFWVGN